MAVKEKIEGDVGVVSVSGKMMGGPDTAEIHEKLKSLLADGIKKIVIDLSQVKWMNSQGLGILMACLTSTRNEGGTLRVAGATEKVNSLFMMTKLVTLFDTFETAERAVAAEWS